MCPERTGARACQLLGLFPRLVSAEEESGDVDVGRRHLLDELRNGHSAAAAAAAAAAAGIGGERTSWRTHRGNRGQAPARHTHEIYTSYSFLLNRSDVKTV